MNTLISSKVNVWMCDALEEQRRIVAEVERRLSVRREVPYGDDIESAVEGALVRAGKLRQAVLKHAFEGKL